MSIGGWVVASFAFTPPASAAPCLPATDQLVSAIAAVAPSSSPLWPQVQSALREGGTDNGQSIEAVLSVLNHNNYSWDCNAHQLVSTNGGAVGSPGAPRSDGSTPGSGSGVTTPAGAPGTAPLVPVEGGASATNTSPSKAAGSGSKGQKPAASDTQIAATPSSATGSSGGATTPLIVIGLLLSIGLVGFVLIRHFRKAREA
jgi:hypothetical protein